MTNVTIDMECSWVPNADTEQLAIQLGAKNFKFRYH